MSKETLIGVGLLVVVLVFSLEWLRSGPDDALPPEELHRDIFIESAGLGDVETMLVMLEEGVDVNVRGTFGGPTALIVGARLGHIDVVQELLARGAEVNAEDDYGQTALYFAKKNGRLRVIEMLEAAGGTSGPVEPRGAEQPVSDV